jgi:NADH-quinone oxidoreductase subunit J
MEREEMMGLSILFWLVATLMLLSAAGVIVNRNPVASALCLVISFVSLAVLYFTLDAAFIGIIQVLVYAGAVMVLFLFIIMLLDLKAEARRRINAVTLLGGIAVTVAFVVQLCAVLGEFPDGAKPFPPLGPVRLNDAYNIGMTLFGGYNLPFQAIGALVLVATIGVVVLSVRELK